MTAAQSAAAEEAKVVLPPLKSLDEALAEAGLNTKTMEWQVKKLLEVKTLEDFEHVDRDDVGQLDDLSAGERRTLWKFISAQQKMLEERKPNKAKKAAAASSSSSSKAGKKAKEKKAKKEKPTYRDRWDFHSAVAFALNPDLTEGAFVCILQFLFSAPKEKELPTVRVSGKGPSS